MGKRVNRQKKNTKHYTANKRSSKTTPTKNQQIMWGKRIGAKI